MRILPTSIALGMVSLAVLGIRPAWSAWSDVSLQANDVPASTEDKERSFHLEVYLRDSSQVKSSVRSPEVVAVNDALRPVLAGTSPETIADEVLSTLELDYPGKVSASPASTYYKAVWCAEIMDFKVMCCDFLQLEVDLGQVVTVLLEIGTRLD